MYDYVEFAVNRLSAGKVQVSREDLITHGGSIKLECPTHDDPNGSLNVTLTPGDKILLHCHAGCEIEDILAKVGLTFADLHQPTPGEVTIGVRHAVYSELLGHLTMHGPELADLQRRKFNNERAYEIGYRSLRHLGLERGLAAARERYGPDVVRLTPGINSFGQAAITDGMGIPVRTATGLIAGIQVRQFGIEPKYRWFSNHENIRWPIHHALPVGDATNSMENLLVVEGPIKADYMTLEGPKDWRVIGLPGINTWNRLWFERYWPTVRQVSVAFDMDWVIKPAVKQTLMKFVRELIRAGKETVVLSWLPQYKGIDDYYAAGFTFTSSHQGQEWLYEEGGITTERKRQPLRAVGGFKVEGDYSDYATCSIVGSR
jgi:hypothetical protein